MVTLFQKTKRLLLYVCMDFKANNRHNYPPPIFLIYDIFFPNYRFRLLFWLRCCEWCRGVHWLFPFYFISKFFWHRYELKSQSEIPFYTTGMGIKFAHAAGTIIINSSSRIGDFVQLSPGNIIGISSIHRKNEVPIIGNHVYLAPNAKVFGRCRIGDNVIIGSDTIIRDMDIPSNSYAVGNPVRIIIK